MAADVLAELERLGRLPARYLILDVSADLRERQRLTIEQAVPHLAGRVEWLDRLPDAFEGVVVANEVLDAMPVERFAIRGGEVDALGVTEHCGRFAWSEIRGSHALREQVRAIADEVGAPWPDRYVSELNTGLASWMTAVAAALTRGAML